MTTASTKMKMHFEQQITNEFEKISSGHKDIDMKRHIVGGFYLSVNSPFKYVGIRRWKNNSNVSLYPTSEGVSLKGDEWHKALGVPRALSMCIL